MALTKRRCHFEWSYLFIFWLHTTPTMYWTSFPDVPIYVCNHEKFGFIMAPLDDDQTIQDDFNQLLNIKQEASGNQSAIAWLLFELFFYPVSNHNRIIEIRLLSGFPADGGPSVVDRLRRRSRQRQIGFRWHIPDQLGATAGTPPPNGVVATPVGSRLYAGQSHGRQVSRSNLADYFTWQRAQLNLMNLSNCEWRFHQHWIP